jgi:hypothetical protein
MIVVECYADEHLIVNLGFSKKTITHKKGKSRVIEGINQLGGGVGIIDKDPDSKPPTDFTDNYIQVNKEGSLSLLQHRDHPERRIIEIHPRLEEWLLARARKNQISPSDFALPNDGDTLHSDPHYERRTQYQTFLTRLIQTDSEMQTLRKWIEGENPVVQNRMRSDSRFSGIIE